MRYEKYVYFFVSISSLLLLIGNTNIFSITAQQEDQTPSWVDFTSLVTDVSVFIIIAFIGFMATKINTWMKSNREWKISIEKNFEKQHARMERFENETKGNVQKLNTAVELLINNFDQYKVMQDREMSEITNDYDALNTIVTENRVQIQNIKEDLKDFKNETRRNK